jgi:hypothetical protein
MNSRPVTVTVLLPEGYRDVEEFASDCGFQLATSPETIWSEFIEACESIEEEAEKETQLVKRTFAEFHYYRGRLTAAKSIRRSVEHPKYRKDPDAAQPRKEGTK